LRKQQRENPNANTAQGVAVTQAAVAELLSLAKTTLAGTPFTADGVETLLKKVDRFSFMSRLEPPLPVPPRGKGERREWLRTGDAVLQGIGDGQIDPAVDAYAAMTAAFKAGDAAAFNQRLADFRAQLAPDFSRELSKTSHEVWFNRMEPFYKAMVLYVLAGLLAGLFWFNLSETLRRSAVWLIGLAFVIHTTGLIYRMVLEGRPPVTNLYSSAIFIGWGAVVLGLVLEGFWKNSIGVVISSAVGFATLIIAHHLSLSGDTMEMMRAVLDTNFWLATHVVVVTLGYASTFVAGFLAIVYIVMGVFTPNLTRPMSRKAAQLTAAAIGAGADSRAKTVVQTAAAAERGALGKSLAKMVYGIVCFATLFSFVGTVLGGIWADQSWGRFW